MKHSCFKNTNNNKNTGVKGDRGKGVKRLELSYAKLLLFFTPLLLPTFTPISRREIFR